MEQHASNPVQTIRISLVKNNKYSNHMSIRIDDKLNWIDVELYIASDNKLVIFDAIKNYMIKIKLIMKALNFDDPAIYVKNMTEDIETFTIREYNFSGMAVSELRLPDIRTKAQTSPSAIDLKDPVSNQQVPRIPPPIKIIDDAHLFEKKQKKKKSVDVVINPEEITRDTKKVLEIMKKVGSDKWPKFLEETDSSKRTCIKYIKNNLNNKNTTVVEHIYNEIVSYLKLNPNFGKE